MRSENALNAMRYGVANVRDVLPFEYVAAPPAGTTIAAGANLAVSVKMHADSDFEISRYACAYWDNAALNSDMTVNTRVMIQITDLTNGVGFFNIPIYTHLFAADALSGAAPFSLKRLIRSNTELQVTFFNTTPSTTIANPRLAMTGNKIFR